MTNYNESAPEFTEHLPFHFLTNAQKAMWVAKAPHIASCLKFSFFSLLYPSPYMVKKKLISNIIHGSQKPVRAHTSARPSHSVPLLCTMHSALPLLWTAHSAQWALRFPLSCPLLRQSPLLGMQFSLVLLGHAKGKDFGIRQTQVPAAPFSFTSCVALTDY